MSVRSTMGETMEASVVVNTYNRAQSLERLLPSLEHLTDVRFEVVIVNGPSTDETDSVINQYRGRVKIVRCATANLSRSRNIGIAATAGEVVVFIDDDALPATVTWLRQLVDVFNQDNDGHAGAAGGASIHRDTGWCEFDGGWTSDYAEQLFTDQPLPLDETPPAGTDGRWGTTPRSDGRLSSRSADSTSGLRTVWTKLMSVCDSRAQVTERSTSRTVRFDITQHHLHSVSRSFAIEGWSP